MMTIGVLIIAITILLLFFQRASEKKVFILKPLDMEKSKLNIDLADELSKCIEEDREFIDGALNNDVDNVIEEFWDSVQTKLNVMSMLGISTDVIYDGLYKHISKMNDRGYVFKDENY